MSAIGSGSTELAMSMSAGTGEATSSLRIVGLGISGSSKGGGSGGATTALDLATTRSRPGGAGCCSGWWWSCAEARGDDAIGRESLWLAQLFIASGLLAALASGRRRHRITEDKVFG
uniref:THFS n=1 Tax=Arundo donax TaxID=35708 RepID=A0A0A9EA87_ARUDO